MSSLISTIDVSGTEEHVISFECVLCGSLQEFEADLVTVAEMPDLTLLECDDCIEKSDKRYVVTAKAEVYLEGLNAGRSR